MIVYALGQLGWSLGSYGAGNLISYFYMPPTDGGAIFPAFLFRGPVLGVLTIVGLLAASGRIFDAVSDPLVAGLSDRNRSPFGKRRIFMAIGGLPFAVSSFFIFFPPVSAISDMNVVSLAVTLFVFYLAMTVYVVPFTAMISELGHTRRRRLVLSTLVSVAWTAGYAIGSQVYLVQGLLEAKLTPTRAFQVTIGSFAAISAVCMYLPVLFIDEGRYARPTSSSQSPVRALMSAIRNRDFMFFSLADLTYWMALTITQMGVSYFVVVLLGLEKQFASLLLNALFIASFACYIPVNRAARRFGKKRVMVVSFILLGVTFVAFFLLGSIAAPPLAQAAVIVVLAAFPIASFGILPTAILADLSTADGAATGNHKAGVFFGTRNFVRKMGISLANLAFPSLLLLGNTAENPTGVRLAAVLAALLCGVGFVAFLFYDEAGVDRALDAADPD
jgi:Na+/melibiose symporter-like transporter